MIKNMFFFSLISLSLSICSIKSYTSPSYSRASSYEHNEEEFDRLKRIRNDRMDKILQKGKQSSSIKEAIEAYQKKPSKFINKFFEFYSPQAIKQVRAYQNKPETHMELEFENKVVMQEIKKFACQLANGLIIQATQKFVGRDRDVIREKIQNRFDAALKECTHNKTTCMKLINDFHPLMLNDVAAFENDIKKRKKEVNERYAQFNMQTSGGVTRNNEYFDRISSGKIFRDTECQVCLESFEELGERVTLVCGHSICPKCLYNYLYVQNHNKAVKCPTCGNSHIAEPIYRTEFPAEYLKQFFY